MRPIFIALLLALMTLLMDPTFAAEKTAAKRAGLAHRCSIYLGERVRLVVHRRKYGTEDYRTAHNAQLLRQMLEAQKTGRGMSAKMFKEFGHYHEWVIRFAEAFRRRQRVVEQYSFVFATNPVWIYATDGEKYPQYYDAGVILVVRDRDMLLSRAVSTEMLDEIFNLRKPLTRLEPLSSVLRTIDDLGDEEERFKLPAPRRF